MSSNQRAEPITGEDGPPGDAELAHGVRVFSALGNRTRYEALRLIADHDGDVCVCELHAELNVSQGAVSQALSRLHDAGVLSRRKDGRWRYYGVTPLGATLLEAVESSRVSDDV